MRVILLVVSCFALLATITASPSRRPCSFEGYYNAGADTTLPCPGFLKCPRGSYCTVRERLPCPEGTFGDDEGLRTKACSGICPAGYYCPRGTSTPLPCGGSHLYCPLGSAFPRSVQEGFFSLGITSMRRNNIQMCDTGHFCNHGNRYPCPAGTYGSSTGLTTPFCTAECPAGHYCPEASAKPIKCPGGTYGIRTGETDSTCSGPCPEGCYCPQGSIAATAFPCGTGTFCPRGSSEPQPASQGAYVINGNSKRARRELPCPAGSYCTGIDGAAQLCPAGTFGETTGLETSRCSGQCAAGYYCPQGSTSSKTFECGGANVFCPVGSGTPTPVAPGYYTVGIASLPNSDQDQADSRTRFAQQRCEPGHYCIDGVRYPCAAGRYGSVFGLTSSDCSGLCAPGHYCPLRSIMSEAKQCGTSEVYCPEGSLVPLRVSGGFCSSGGSDPRTHSDQRPAQPGEFAWKGTCYLCPAGTFGASEAETQDTCSGLCRTGFYCPEGSVSETQRECGGAHVFCPEGSKLPIPVDTGYYTSKDLDEPCPPGKYRDQLTTTSQFIHIATGQSPVRVNYGDALFPLAQCTLCPDGTYKPVPGDDPALCQPCPVLVASSLTDRRSCICFRLPGGPGFDTTSSQLHFNGSSCDLRPLGWVEPSSILALDSIYTRSQQFPCERGFFCLAGVRKPCPAGFYGDTVLETRPQCAGKCDPGFYCPLASNNSTAQVCGDPSVFCPVGSNVPTPVTPGYYTVRTSVMFSLSVSLNASTNKMIRDAQIQCEPGSYCINGLKILCPGGRYGDKYGETAPQCAGACSRGFYCPVGSTSAQQRACGGSDRICRTGSATPEIVPPGYYSLGGSDTLTNTTRFHQQPCEPGHFCLFGVKYQCPAGTFGATTGLATTQCSGLCQAGYYCPSYPYTPSTSPTQFECGNSTVYCPEGTGNFPLPVDSGFFSVGAGDGTGDAKNTTRTAQMRCPRGFYCRQGIRIRCPEGTHGDREGLTSTQCSGWCPAGYFCPPSTINYRSNPCPHGTYSTFGSTACITCTSQNQVLPSSFHLTAQDASTSCTDKRECCFFG